MSFRMALPPLTLGLYRDVYITVVLYGLKYCDGYFSNLNIGFDRQKNVDFVEILGGDLDAFAECFSDLYNIKLSGPPLRDLERILYDGWLLAFNPRSGVYRVQLGGSSFSASGTARDVVDYAKFFYSRDAKTFQYRSESYSKGKPKPVAGFMDIGFDAPMGSRVAWILGKYMPSRNIVEGVNISVYVVAVGIPENKSRQLSLYARMLFEGDFRVVDVIDTKKGKALRPAARCSTFLASRLAQKDPDLAYSWFLLFMLSRVYVERVDTSEIAGLPPIRVYSVNSENPKFGWMFELNFRTVGEVRHEVEAASLELGVSPARLVIGLRQALEHLASASAIQDEKVASAVEALKPRMRITIREVFDGRGASSAQWLYALVREAQLASQQVPQIADVVSALADIFERREGSG